MISRSFDNLIRKCHASNNIIFRVLCPITGSTHSGSNNISEWIGSLRDHCPERHVALDGKTIMGSKQKHDGSGAIHIVSAFATDSGLVIDQQKVADKSNEITAIPELLKRLALEGTVAH